MSIDWQQRYEAERRAREHVEAQLLDVRAAHAALVSSVDEVRARCDALSRSIDELATPAPELPPPVHEIVDPASESSADAYGGNGFGGESELVTGRAVVLVAADHRESAVDVLESAGLRVDSVATTGALVETVVAANPTEEPYVIVLVDTSDTQLAGFKATRQLRRSGYCGVVIALTTGSDGSETAKCLEAGCDDYLTLPLNRRRLLKKIQRAIAQVSLDL